MGANHSSCQVSGNLQRRIFGSSKMEATTGCRTAPQPAELSEVIHAGLAGPMAKEDCYNVANASPV